MPEIERMREMTSDTSKMYRWIPAWHWLREYRLSWLRGDTVAGITLAAYLLPAGLGDASLANLPPEAGLYARLFSGLMFWIFCSSRHTAITVTSAISLLLGSSLGPLAGGDPARFYALASCTALLVAALAFLAWLIKGESVRKAQGPGWFSVTCPPLRSWICMPPECYWNCMRN